jgi:corrinoid protein of di/trimethylamine methyltransferase
LEIEKIKEAVIELDDDTTKELVSKAIHLNIEPQEILEKGLIAGMKAVGDLFFRKEYFVPEVLLASEVFYAGFNIIKPLIKPSRAKQKTKIVIGVVEGDIHDIGKNIVKVLMEASGYEVTDLGQDVSAEKFIHTVAQEKPDVLALSSLMTTTMIHMTDIIRGLEDRKLRSTVKIIIGGAPVNLEFAREIRADGYGKDAHDAVRLVETLTGG